MSYECILNGITFARQTERQTDRAKMHLRRKNYFFRPEAFRQARPPRRVPFRSSVRQPSSLPYSRSPGVFPPSLSIRSSVSPLPIRQSLVRSPVAFPAREKSTRTYAKRRTRSRRRGPALGRSRGKLLGAFIRGCRRTGGNGTATRISFLPGCAEILFSPLINAEWALKVLRRRKKFPAPRGNNSCDK